MRTTVITSILGNHDHLRTPLVRPDGVQFVCYADVPMWAEGWQIQPAYQPYESRTRNSRIPKILSHLHCETEFSIWHDGCFTVARSPQETAAKYLRDADIALYRHPGRPDIYKEAEFCRRAAASHAFGDDLVASIMAQVETYRADGYPGTPFVCGGIIIRRENDAVRRFNEMWWNEYRKWGVRDQFSLNYCLWKSGIRLAVIEHYIHQAPHFDFTFHAGTSNPTNDACEPERRQRMARRKQLEELCQ